MSRELIHSLYADTALWLWPVLWLEILRMQYHLARLPDADDPQVLYEIRVNQWGQLSLIELPNGFGADALQSDAAACAMAYASLPRAEPVCIIPSFRSSVLPCAGRNPVRHVR